MTYSYDRRASPETQARAEAKKAWEATKKALANRSSGSHLDAAKAHEAAAKAWRRVVDQTPAGDAKTRAQSIWAMHVGISARHEKDKDALEQWEQDDMRGPIPGLHKYDDVAKLWKTEAR